VSCCCYNSNIKDTIDRLAIWYDYGYKYEDIKAMGQGSQTNINAQIVKDISIQLPPLEKQKEIVEKLDQFEVLNLENLSEHISSTVYIYYI